MADKYGVDQDRYILNYKQEGDQYAVQYSDGSIEYVSITVENKQMLTDVERSQDRIKKILVNCVFGLFMFVLMCSVVILLIGRFGLNNIWCYVVLLTVSLQKGFDSLFLDYIMAKKYQLFVHSEVKIYESLEQDPERALQDTKLNCRNFVSAKEEKNVERVTAIASLKDMKQLLLNIQKMGYGVTSKVVEEEGKQKINRM